MGATRCSYKEVASDGRYSYFWLTQPWKSFWFQHGPNRFNLYHFCMEGAKPGLPRGKFGGLSKG